MVPTYSIRTRILKVECIAAFHANLDCSNLFDPNEDTERDADVVAHRLLAVVPTYSIRTRILKDPVIDASTAAPIMFQPIRSERGY